MTESRTDTLLEGLNERQLEAVTETLDQPTLVIAGAGSGKTGVLTRRAAYIIQERVGPEHQMIVTFTNKAAREMKERIEKYAGQEAADKITMGTFHSIAVRILRRHGAAIGVHNRFTIFDQDDQKQIMRDALRQHGFNTDATAVRGALGKISDLKNNLLTPERFREQMARNPRHEPSDLITYKVYKTYQELLEKHRALDFDDLIMKTVHLLSTSPDVRKYYQDRYKYVMVDEYQDTNPAQYKMIRLIAGNNNVFVVGDDYQCWEKDTEIYTDAGPILAKHLKAGDKVQTSETGKQSFAEATGVHVIHSAPLVRITTTSGKSIEVTPNHKCYATMPNFDGAHYLYLMYRKDKGYRIGLLTGGIEGTIGSRAHSERPERLWLLARYETKAEAAYHESRLSLRYKIPTLPFIHNGRGLSMPQENLDAIFQEFGANGEILLNEMGYHFDYPHYVPQGTTKFGASHRVVNVMTNVKGVNQVSLEYEDVRVRKWISSYKEAMAFALDLYDKHQATFIRERYSMGKGQALQLYTANSLLPTMQVPVVTDNGDFVLEEIVSIEDAGGGEVIDIEVARTGMVVGNGILTHNSIYGFRGSDLSIILNFEQDYPGCKIVKLEQNYRSTKTIVHAGNMLMKKNKGQKDKFLFTENTEGSKVKVYTASDGQDEARYVVRQIQTLAKLQNRPYKDFAVLYRQNFLSQEIEKELNRNGIAYNIVGGVSFYERMEIKDMLAYLRVVSNPRDDIAMKRVLSIAPGIGKTTIQSIFDLAEQANVPLFAALKNFTHTRKNIMDAIDSIRSLLNELHRYYQLGKAVSDKPVSEMLEIVLRKTGYRDNLMQKKDEDSLSRAENLDELLKVMEQYDEESDDPNLTEFLENAALATDKDKDAREQQVNLMTLHASKGLEFPVVFLIGWEQGIFPSQRAATPEDIEEERRLAYVGITRAEKEAYITNARKRLMHRQLLFNAPSMFINDIPKEVLIKA